MITRRCTQRQFLMRPDRETNNAFVYCLAVAAQRYGIRVLFTVAMSNHHHTGIHDPEGNYPAFIEHFHKLFAKCQNALRSRWENFWSSEQASVVRLVDPNDVIDKMTYAITNPVKDSMVEKAHHWPGVTSLDALVHVRPLTAARPTHFFREDGPMPEVVSLSFGRPEGFEPSRLPPSPPSSWTGYGPPRKPLRRNGAEPELPFSAASMCSCNVGATGRGAENHGVN